MKKHKLREAGSAHLIGYAVDSTLRSEYKRAKEFHHSPSRPCDSPRVPGLGSACAHEQGQTSTGRPSGRHAGWMARKLTEGCRGGREEEDAAGRGGWKRSSDDEEPEPGSPR